MLFSKTIRWIGPLLVLTFVSLACSLTQGTPDSVQPTASPVPFQATASPPSGESEEQPEAGEGGAVSAERQDLATFEALVREAVIQRNQEALAGLMGDPFSIGWWQSEGTSMSPAEAAEELVMGWLIPGNPVAFVEGADLTGMLGGTDPLTMWGPDVDARGTLLCTGWGSNAFSEAILVIAWDDTVGHYWHGVLIAPEGFVQLGDNVDFRQQFGNEVMRVIIERDFDAMPGLMTNPFEIALWQSQGVALPPAEAVEQVRLNYPPEGYVIAYSDPQPDLTGLLGRSPGEFFGGGISFLHTVGWGESGTGEAIIVIDADANGVLRWSKILFAPAGF